MRTKLEVAVGIVATVIASAAGAAGLVVWPQPGEVKALVVFLSAGCVALWVAIK